MFKSGSHILQAITRIYFTMNKTFNKLVGISSSGNKEPEDKKVKTSGKLFDWCNRQLIPMGLHVDNVTPYSLAVYRGGDVIGYYNTLTEIKQAIIAGYVQENYNL